VIPPIDLIRRTIHPIELVHLVIPPIDPARSAIHHISSPYLAEIAELDYSFEILHVFQ
jgi:hypothetical protein